jgi:16S rRNA (guanine966-N2)-methyltransferase
VSSSPRVIAGRFRGRSLSTPPGLATRPTGARVREALFSILGPLEGARVLDLYAGSGALAIEALSRGAKSAVLVERDRRAVSAIRDNLATLSLAGDARVLALAVERAVAALSSEAPFDLVLCDPPWAAGGSALPVLAKLTLCGKLASGARVVLEHPSRDTPEPPKGLERFDQRSFGDTGLSFFRAAIYSAAEP